MDQRTREFNNMNKFMLLILFLTVSSDLFAQRVLIHARLSPAGRFTIEGTSLAGVVQKSGVFYTGHNIVLDLRNLKSGNELRDTHIQNHFETDKFPTAVLSQGRGSDGKFSATLKIRNISKKIEGAYEVSGAEGKAFFKTRLSDFGIKKAMYLGVGVHDEVQVEVSMPLPR
jgi:hypothetical protein